MTSGHQLSTKHLMRPQSVCSRRRNTADEIGNAYRRALYIIDSPRPTKGNYHANCGLKNYSRINTPRIQDIEREKYSFKSCHVRPKSAPHQAVKEYRLCGPKSAKARTAGGRTFNGHVKQDNE